MTVYVTLMCRYGSESDGAYVLGVWSDEHEAIKQGLAEKAWRGDKYSPKVFTFKIDGNECNEGIG